MITWLEKLEAWNYPRAEELAPVLEQLGIEQRLFTSPVQLATCLSKLQRPEWIPLWTWEDIWKVIKNFLDWVWSFIAPWAVDVGLIALGAVITWLAGGWYKAIGVIPMGVGIYRILDRTGVI